MSTLNEHKSNDNSTETDMQLEDIKGQIDSILQQFDVLTSRFDKFMFKIYLYLFGLLFLGEAFIAILSVSRPQARLILLVLGVTILPMIVLISYIWAFNTWRLRATKMLRDVLEKKRIYLCHGDANTSYLRFLESYRGALASPKRYFFSNFPMIIIICLCIYPIVQIPSILHLNTFLELLFLVGSMLTVFAFLGVLYCGGIGTWVMLISGWHIRKLVQTFDLRIQPFHTDKCGGLKMLGDFCFGLVSPFLINNGFVIGYLFIYFITGSFNSVSTSGLDTVSQTLIRLIYVGFPLLFFLLIGPAIVLTFILPLWNIHTKMVKEREANEDTYNTRIEVLREEIQSLLDNNKIEDAKRIQEKKGILETLHIPYPTWPFSLHTKIFSTLLGACGSLLIGVVTAAIPVILPSILHNL